jgi:hypothetical protein
MAAMGSPSDVAADFLDYLQQLEVLAIDPNLPDPQRKFVSTHALERYLDKPTLESLLGYCYESVAEWRTIKSGYLAVFALLITIRKGAYIKHFIRHNHLTDDRLPFLNASDLPRDCNYFFTQFEEAQWRFCALSLQEDRLVNKRFAPELIIPFTSCKLVKSGPDSNTYIVEVHPDYSFPTNDVRIASNHNNRCLPSDHDCTDPLHYFKTEHFHS